MIIYRIKTTKDKVYKYQDVKGTEIKDKKVLEYIANLHIPPAYNDVEIYYEKTPKIMFSGIDNAGRLQQIYSPTWTKKASMRKFAGLVEFGHALPKIYMEVNHNIKSLSMTKEKVIALIIKIISLCYFRVGNQKYYTLYGSHGISNIKKKHLKMTKDGLEIKFIGKKSMENQCIISDKVIIAELTAIAAKKKPDEFIFTYIGENGEELVKPIAINLWLNKFGKGFTTKDFRTFDTNTLLLDFIHDQHKAEAPIKMTVNQRKKILIQGLKNTSCMVNNTPAICKKSYVNAGIVDMYLENPKKFATMFLNGNSSRINFIRYLDGL